MRKNINEAVSKYYLNADGFSKMIFGKVSLLKHKSQNPWVLFHLHMHLCADQSISYSDWGILDHVLPLDLSLSPHLSPYIVRQLMLAHISTPDRNNMKQYGGRERSSSNGCITDDIVYMLVNWVIKDLL